MELITESDNTNIKTIFDLNNKFVKHYPFCDITSNDYRSKGTKKFIGMLTKHGTTILAAEYIFLGTYTMEKNVWIWSDVSVTMDRTMSNEVSNIRSMLLKQQTNDDKLKLFIESDYSILPTMDCTKMLSKIGILLFDTIKSYILTNAYRQIVDVLLIKRIVHDGTSINPNTNNSPDDM